ncbi:MAG: hypothetical protein IPI48_03270 [bacterium]|nr:hypothetical protein [bacterium]
MRRMTMFALVAVLVMLAGCVKLRSTIVIDADGSGTCTLNYGMSKDVADAIAVMGESDEDGEKAPTLDDFDRARMEKLAKANGVTIKSYERTNVDGRDDLAIVMKFKDVTGLSRVMQSGENQVMAIRRTEDGNYMLTMITDPNPPAPEPVEAVEADEDAPAAAGEDPAKAMEAMGKLMASISELDVRMEITVPGNVLSSNAPAVEGRTSIWTINAANMMESQGGDMSPMIAFDKGGVAIDAPKLEE